MEQTTPLSWRQVWNLAMALVVALTVIGAAPEFAAAEKKESPVAQRDRFEAACADAGGISYGSDSSNFGCWLEDVTIECNHGMVAIYGWSSCERVMEFEPDDVDLVQPVPSPSDTTDTLYRVHNLSGEVWLPQESPGSKEAGGDASSAVGYAEVIPPATAVLSTRGKTIVPNQIDAQAAADVQLAPQPITSQRIDSISEIDISEISEQVADQGASESQSAQPDPSEASMDSQSSDPDEVEAEQELERT